MINTFKKGGTAHITKLINEALASRRRTAIVTGNWEIDEAVRLPSNFTIILQDCHLRQADGCYSNIFVNEHNETPEGTTQDGTDRNINIIGRGVAVLDGGSHNGLCEAVPPAERIAPLYKNNLILFTNVDGFKISGIRCVHQRWWSINLIFCANGYVGNIDFLADDSAVDADGNLYHGLIREKPEEVCVKNADGVDLRQGCHDIIIENLTGFTEDDTVALTGLAGKTEGKFRVEGLSTDICNVKIRNIHASSYCTLVRLLNQGDTKLHDIDIDGIYDVSADSPHLDHGNFAIRIGDMKMYSYRHCTKEETYNISIKNIYGRGRAAIALAGEIGNLTIYGVECGENTPMFYEWEKIF